MLNREKIEYISKSMSTEGHIESVVLNDEIRFKYRALLEPISELYSDWSLILFTQDAIILTLLNNVTGEVLGDKRVIRFADMKSIEISRDNISTRMKMQVNEYETIFINPKHSYSSYDSQKENIVSALAILKDKDIVTIK